MSELVVGHTGMCLDVDNASTSQGARILQWPCTGDFNQLFKVN
jgi:hypothetical protein